MLFRGSKRIVLHAKDRDPQELVISEVKVEDGIAYFGRDDHYGRGWRPFVAVPVDSIIEVDFR